MQWVVHRKITFDHWTDNCDKLLLGGQGFRSKCGTIRSKCGSNNLHWSQRSVAMVCIPTGEMQQFVDQFAKLHVRGSRRGRANWREPCGPPEIRRTSCTAPVDLWAVRHINQTRPHWACGWPQCQYSHSADPEIHQTGNDNILVSVGGGYNQLGNLGYIHSTVNHSRNFVDPTTGTCTNAIEESKKMWNFTGCPTATSYLSELTNFCGEIACETRSTFTLSMRWFA